MNVAVIGATGNIGSRVVAELVARGHAATVVSRHPEKTAATANVTAKLGDGDDPAALAAVLRGHDAVVSSCPFTPGLAAKLIDAVRRSGVKRYLMVGGAGSLEVAPGKMLKDTLTLPDFVRAIIEEGTNALVLIRQQSDLDWTFFSPAGEIGPGARTGKFRLGGDQLVVDAEGKSRISYDDYAIALVDELEKPQHIRKRFTAAY